jgi:hypothetical protein
MAYIEPGTDTCVEIEKIKRKLYESRTKEKTASGRKFIDEEIKRADNMLEIRRKKNTWKRGEMKL